MVKIPAGEFTMGTGVGHGEADEFPKHAVWIDEFLIGKHLVTAVEWAAFLNDDGAPEETYFSASRETTVVNVERRYFARKGCGLHPANGVTWFGAERYCQWLKEKTGKPYRLPTEAEWEKAARGGLEQRIYPWGNDCPLGLAQYQQVWSTPMHTLSPVGVYPPNGYGVCDMAGNVWEWCRDWYERDYYHSSPSENPEGPETGTLKVLRGGSWGGLDVQIRCGIRVGEYPDISESRIGFRIARSLD